MWSSLAHYANTRRSLRSWAIECRAGPRKRWWALSSAGLSPKSWKVSTCSGPKHWKPGPHEGGTAEPVEEVDPGSPKPDRSTRNPNCYKRSTLMTLVEGGSMLLCTGFVLPLWREVHRRPPVQTAATLAPWMREWRRRRGSKAREARNLPPCPHEVVDSKNHEGRAAIQKQESIALIDNRSTHNFISERLVNSLQLLVVPTPPFLVKVANGDLIRCRAALRISRCH